MKTKNISKAFCFLGCLLLLSCSSTNQSSVSPQDLNISYQTFYDDLSPYGTWINYPTYGNVWHPSISGDFRPYLTNGYWNYSDEGWLWTSNYQWGWAPFHYGRWVYDNSYGWLWTPGYEWAPAWVTWGTYDNYYGWAPLMPDVNVGINFSSYNPPSVYWNLCDRKEIYNRNIESISEKREVVNNNYSRINVINNFNTTNTHNQYYSKGPDIDEVQKFTNKNINPVKIKDVNNVAQMAREKESSSKEIINSSSINIDKEPTNSVKVNLPVYRPNVVNPQPRQFKTIDNSFSNPVRNNNEVLPTQRIQQQQNIERLPVQQAPQRSFRMIAKPSFETSRGTSNPIKH